MGGVGYSHFCGYESLMKRHGIFLGGSRWQNGHYQSGEPAYAPPPDPPIPDLQYPNIGVGCSLVGNLNGFLDFNVAYPELYNYGNLNYNYPEKYVQISDNLRMWYSVPQQNYTPTWGSYNTDLIGQINCGTKTDTLLPNNNHLFVNGWLSEWDNYKTWEAARPQFQDPTTGQLLIKNPRFWVNYTAWYWRLEELNDSGEYQPINVGTDYQFDFLNLKNYSAGAELVIPNYFYDKDTPDFPKYHDAYVVKNAGGVLPASEIESIDHTSTDYVGSLGNLDYKDVKSVLNFLGFRHKQTRQQVAGYLGVENIADEPLPFGNGNLIGLPYIIPWRWRYTESGAGGESYDYYPTVYNGGVDMYDPKFDEKYAVNANGLLNPRHFNEPFGIGGFSETAPAEWKNGVMGVDLNYFNPFFSCVRNLQHANNKYFYLDNLYDVFVVRDRKYMTYTAIQFYLVSQRATDNTFFVVGG